MVDHLGLTFGGNAPKLELPRPGHLGVPRYPGPTVMRASMVPAPPKLDPDLEPFDRAALLARHYRDAVEAKYKSPCFALRSGLARSRYRKTLEDAAQVMLDYDIRPAAWVAFSLAAWQRDPDGKARPPPLPWTFAPGRIEERFEWFRSVESTYMGGRVIYSPAAQDMLVRYEAMRLALMWAQPKSEEAVRAVVEQHFPGGLYGRLLLQANTEAADNQRRMNELSAQGGWLWG